MSEYRVIFHSIAEVAEFVGAVNRYPYQVELVHQEAIFNARSLLNLFCLQLQTPVTLRVTEKADDSFRAAIRPYLAELQPA